MKEIINEQKELDIYIGKRLRIKRQKLGLTLLSLAEKLGVSHQQIQKYEKAQSRISAIVLYQLSQILGVESNYFFQGFTSFSKDEELASSDIIIPDHECSLNVLLIEDDVADELCTRRAFSECSAFVNLLTVHNSIIAMNFLRKKLITVDFPRPDIILLDLNISKRDGATMLREIKRDRDLSDIPVIIMTNGINFQEMLSCYKAYASGCICKSFNYDIFQKNIENLTRYWAKSVILPNRARKMNS